MRRLLLLALLFFCSAVQPPSLEDFDGLMCRDIPELWQNIQTEKDFEELAFFRKLYAKNLIPDFATEGNLRIPKVLHLVWIGPAAFPQGSVKNVQSWIDHHPGWKVKFWTDRERPCPTSGMERHFTYELNFTGLKECYAEADNYGEKADLLRYEILYQEGGLYVDHDEFCLNSFDGFHHAYDFYAALERPYDAAGLPSVLIVGNNVIGARPRHPILKECIEYVASKWKSFTRDYPGEEREAIFQRTTHRTLYPFTIAVHRAHSQKGLRDIIFPTYYFHAPEESLSLWVKHTDTMSWLPPDKNQQTHVERKVLSYLSNFLNFTTYTGIAAVVLIVAQAALLIFFFRKRRRRR